MKTRTGFTLVEIMIVVAIIGLLAMIAIPAYSRARTKSQRTVCINNLLKIDGAIDQWAIETFKSTGDPVHPTEPLLYLKRQPVCPAGGTYGANFVGQPPFCTLGPTHGHVL